jgi:hypothetical protein
MGTVSASEWETYMQHFVPYENQLIQYATDPTVPGTAMSTAETLQQQGNAQATGMQTRALAQMDTSLNPQEAAAMARQSQVSGVLATVGAGNTAKDQAVANQMSVLGTPSTGITGSA